VLGVICAMLVAWAVKAFAPNGSFVDRFKLVALIGLAVTAYTDIGQPVFNHAPWGYYIYLWISDLASWVAAGAVIGWFVPRAPVVKESIR